MAITRQQAERFNKWLEEVGVHTLSCEVCKSNDYHSDIILVVPQHTEGRDAGGWAVSGKGFDLAEPTGAYVQLACKKCGCVKLFDAGKAGITS